MFNNWLIIYSKREKFQKHKVNNKDLIIKSNQREALKSMIGFLITGHSEFPKGLQSSLKMIAGNQNNLKVIKFKEEKALKDYQLEITKAVNKLQDENDGVIIFTDLLGGTPYKVSSIVASEYKNIEVVTGTNLPMLLEGTVLRHSVDNVSVLANVLIDSAKEGITSLSQVLANTKNTKENVEEGI